VTANPTLASYDVRGCVSTLAVVLTDAFRNPVNGEVVTLAGSVIGNGRTIAPINGTTGSNGQAAFTATGPHQETNIYAATHTITQTARVIYT